MYKKAKYIIETLESKGYIAYLAGGCVRDLLLGYEPEDYDIATSATPDEIEKIFNHTIPVGRDFGVMMVVLDDHPFEVATFRADYDYIDGRRPSKIKFCHPEEDAYRRDFTINGLFMKIYKGSLKKQLDLLEENNDEVTNYTFLPFIKGTKKGIIIDYVNGLQDIYNKTLCFIHNPHDRILEDHLRILRGIRFKHKLQFNYDINTFNAIKKHKNLIKKISPERIHEELTKILHLIKNTLALDEMYKIGLLEIIVPEFKNMHKTKQHPLYHAEGDVWTHTLLCLKEAYNESDDITWAIFLHDIGKVFTTYYDRKKQKYRSPNHDIVGAKKAIQIMKRLKFSNKSIDKISWIIEQHLRIHTIFNMRLHKQKTLSYHEYFPDLLKVHYYDESGRIPSQVANNQKISKLYNKLIKEKPKDIKTLIDGTEVMKIMKIRPGKFVGEILNKIKEAQYEGVIKTKTEAINYLKNHI